MHFVGLALALFLFAELAGAVRGHVIEIDPLEVEWRIQQLERGRGSALTQEERALAEQAYIDEQILAREARLRSLDDDARIRSILSQKMLHVLSTDVAQPSDDELREYYAKNRARYARAPSVTVDQVLTAGGERSGPQADDEKTVLSEVTLDQLSLAFGPETAARIFGVTGSGWVGPHRTARGDLWFRVVERFEAGAPPPFEEVLGQVRFDWISEREEVLLQERLAELRSRYSVRLLPPEGES